MPLQNILHESLSYNREIGIFVRKPRKEVTLQDRMSNSRLANKEAGTKGLKSIIIYVDGIPYAAHRIAWVFIYGDVLTTDMQIDHINNDPFDNRIENLRIATHAQNCSNARKWRKKALPKGISKATNSVKYRARLQVGRQVVHIGSFDTPELAHIAYTQAAKKYHGEFARAI